MGRRPHPRLFQDLHRCSYQGSLSALALASVAEVLHAPTLPTCLRHHAQGQTPAHRSP